jgi:hypothetical protein
MKYRLQYMIDMELIIYKNDLINALSGSAKVEYE